MVVGQFGNFLMEKVWAIIPARSGSKGLKNKNIIKINHKPLIYYTIKSALKTKKFEKVLFLTDSIKYAKIAKSYGAEIPFIRSKKNASNIATDNDLYINMLKIFTIVRKHFCNSLRPLPPQWEPVEQLGSSGPCCGSGRKN